MSTQTFPESPEFIYNTLLSDATFASYLGEYSFLSGQVLPAIGVQSPGSDMPGLDRISGLECVIHDAADLRRRQFYESTNVESKWKVFLICWEPANGSVMNAAAKRAMEIFGGSETIETVAVADGLGALVQTMLLIPSYMPVLN